MNAYVVSYGYSYTIFGIYKRLKRLVINIFNMSKLFWKRLQYE